ncbi:MAG: hypothetical protein ABIF18_01555 [archaeon]
MEQDIAIKLDMISRNVIMIKDYLEDVMLTRDDLDSIREADEDLERGRTMRLD